MTPETKSELIDLAREAKQNAYSPYSDYSVGAVVVTQDGTQFTGSNIENSTLDMCSHAERTAMRTAIAEGYRNFQYMAISTEEQNGTPPCGTCRQFLAEFCGDDFPILSDNGDDIEKYTLGEIFPHAFRPEL